jgi:hypothetical protein
MSVNPGRLLSIKPIIELAGRLSIGDKDLSEMALRRGRYFKRMVE